MKKYASLLILAAGTCWGCLGIFVRNLNSFGIESMEIVEVRSIVCVFLLAMVILIVLILTMKAASLYVAAVLLYTAPFFVKLLSAVLFRESITGRKIVSLIMAFAGCMLVSGVFDGSAILTTKGLLIGLCSGIGYACYTIFLRYAVNYGYHPLTAQFYTFLIAAVGGAFLTDFGRVAEGIETGGAVPILLFLGIGLVSTTIPNLLYNTGMKYSRQYQKQKGKHLRREI